MEAAILDAAGMLPDEPELTMSHPLLPSLASADFRLTDLTVTSPDLPRDTWSDPEIDWKLLAKSVDKGTRWVGHSDFTVLQLGLPWTTLA